MLIQLQKTTGETIGLNTEVIWKVINNAEAGSTVKVGAKSYELSTSYSDVLALGCGAFKEYDFIVGGETIAFALNPTAIARVSRDRSKVYFHLTTGDKLQVDATFSEAVPSGGVVTKTEDFVANGPSGTTYVSGSAELEGITVTFVDSPIGTEYTFFRGDLAMVLNVDEGLDHQIQFWDGENDRETPYVMLGNQYNSITIKKISADRWAGIAVNGAIDWD